MNLDEKKRRYKPIGWKVKSHNGEFRAVVHYYDEQGRLHTDPMPNIHATREAAEQEGRDSGLSEWRSDR
jgi:hypothetical protein